MARSFLKIYWRTLFAVAWPLLLSPLPLIFNASESRCAYVVLLMAGYWVIECFPLAVTSLLPVVLFPLFGILSTADTCLCYMNDTIMVFLGGLIVALAIQHSKLHLRVALGALKMLGCSHGKLLAGVCAVTTFMSMWVSNTAATAMIVPIIFAVLQEFENAGINTVFETRPLDPEDPNSETEIEPTIITKAYLFAAAFCATFGGTGSLVGTGTNLAFKGIYDSSFPRSGGMNFSDWLVASFPQMIGNSFLTWFYIRVAYMGFLRPASHAARKAEIGEDGIKIANQVIHERYKELGPMTFHEIAVAHLFVACTLLWIFRKPGFIPGWSELITEIEIKDSTPVIFVSIMMFIIPKDPSCIYVCSKNPDKRPSQSSEGLITWKVVESKMPWGLMLLLGGGFAISKGSNSSLLAKRIGEALVPLRTLPPLLILIVICLFVGLLTEFTTNVGVANITLPVIAQMCVAMKIHPLYLMIPATLVCSFSFRLPVGTPPNAIITAQGFIPTKSLIIAGSVPSVYSVIVVIVCFLTWGKFIYGIEGFPEWAVLANETEN